MKKFLFLLLLPISFYCYADAGFGYRFHIKAELHNSEIIDGYIYVYSWDEYKGFGKLKEFLNKNIQDNKLFIYNNITTVSLGIHNIDFTIKDSYYTIKLDDIAKINESEILSFGGGVYRLMQLSDDEFSLIQIQKPNLKHFNAYDILEYCHFFLISWNKKINTKFAESIYQKIKTYKKVNLKNSLEGENGKKFYLFLENLKKETLTKDILLIQYCESC